MSKVNILSVEVVDRHRKDLGDIAALAASIERVGLLHPIVVTRKGKKLIAGERRYRAVKSLGWPQIEATLVDLDEGARLVAERDENMQRKPLTRSESVAVAREIEAIEKEKAKERQREAGAKHGRGIASGDSPEAIQKGEAKEIAAKKVGMGRKTLEKAEEVVAAAEADQETFGPIVEEMDKTGNVEAAVKKVREKSKPKPKLRRAELIEETPCPTCHRPAPVWVVGKFPAPEGETWEWE